MRDFLDRRPVIVGYLIATVIFGALLYVMLFEINADHRANCDRRNTQIEEVNERTSDIDKLARSLQGYMLARLAGDTSVIAEGVPVVESVVKELDQVRPDDVPLIDCKTDFDQPWPFG